MADKIVSCYANISEEKVCSRALRFMFQVLNWNFKSSPSALDNSSSKSNSGSFGIKPDMGLLKKFERSLVEVAEFFCLSKFIETSSCSYPTC